MAQNGNEFHSTEPITIENSATPSTLMEKFVTKLCHIVKRHDFEGYGFNLHSEKSKRGQFIGKVDANSPAEAAGLKEGDRIIEVNGVPIGNETHKQVVQRIKAISGEVRLLLVDVDQIKSESPSSLENQGTVKNIPGASANIKSISISSKRVSKSTSGSVDVTDKAFQSNQNETALEPSENRNTTYNNNNMEVPPPPSAAIASIASSNNNNTGLQLPTTAAEMRAKLLTRKKYDPKNEGVDLKKKFEIIQKL